jgi:hypothetical protein
MRNLLFAITGIVFFAFGCASKVTTTGTSGKYSEDLSAWRPSAEKTVDSVKTTSPVRSRINQYVEAKYAINGKLDIVLDSMYQQNLSKESIDGFTIQVYSGVKREEALNIKKELSQAFPEIDSDVQYRQPNFRVKAGKYLTVLEAQQDYLMVKRRFPNAIVIPDKVSFDR